MLKIKDYCQESLDLMIDFIQLRFKLEKGERFTFLQEKIENISKFEITKNQLKKL